MDKKMPVYEYRCDACNIQFELRQKFSDPPADKCPKCGGAVRKLVSAASFSLKGGGWYGDGYGAKAEPDKSEGDTAVGTEATKEGSSTDGAPAPAKTEKPETTASPITQTSAPTQIEAKSKSDDTPTPTKEKTEVKSQKSDVAA
jgi:putative FmdB family regulatory protein